MPRTLVSACGATNKVVTKSVSRGIRTIRDAYLVSVPRMPLICLPGRRLCIPSFAIVEGTGAKAAIAEGPNDAAVEVEEHKRMIVERRV